MADSLFFPSNLPPTGDICSSVDLHSQTAPTVARARARTHTHTLTEVWLHSHINPQAPSIKKKEYLAGTLDMSHQWWTTESPMWVERFTLATCLSLSVSAQYVLNAQTSFFNFFFSFIIIKTDLMLCYNRMNQQYKPLIFPITSICNQLNPWIGLSRFFGCFNRWMNHREHGLCRRGCWTHVSALLKVWCIGNDSRPTNGPRVLYNESETNSPRQICPWKTHCCRSILNWFI